MKAKTSHIGLGTAGSAFFSFHSTPGLIFILLNLLFVALLVTLYLYLKTKELKELSKEKDKDYDPSRLQEYLSSLDGTKISRILRLRRSGRHMPVFTGFVLLTEPGIIILLILILIPIVFGILLMAIKVTRMVTQYRRRGRQREDTRFNEYLDNLQGQQAEDALDQRKEALNFHLSQTELSGDTPARDTRGLLYNISSEGVLPFVAVKKRAARRPPIDPALSRLVIWYIGCAAAWLLIGTTIGEYIGIKFVAPDADHLPWLSFGRLRPVHTNAVFWGWASLGMLGLGHYIIPRVSNAPLHSIKKGWWTLILINAAVLLGSFSLMAGINNGGGEYREYIWPIMSLFGLGCILALQNFLRTVAKRTTHEIYISNWYIISALMFVLVIAFIAYLPWWQNGLGETIVQGYYMHQGVGMWFMFFTLGIVYYFLPQQLNRPIWSYSLGILAFWSQILFYTVIGTHHFVFSSIPWWLQTVAIVGSMGMIIPVTAGTTNFLLTIRGSWHSLSSSYTLPFFLVGIIFYFTGSMQGTAEAFRSTNRIWHFTDFTVAHSHLTMYGIISFFLWASMYAVVPRLTGKEAPQLTIGAHFWLALIGLLFYTVPLMYGSTLKGVMWTEGKPFLDGVVFMAPYWLWRAIGGSLMWLSHLFFCYNIYRMVELPQPKIQTVHATI
ncbi:MAG: cbb3-type cytochrome c oxidase subunit I [Sphingobacteriales bacterium]|mgnify:CR=1 FL=1|nr:cbb3-type cytochrome c oxidase subunit I [Sphingobacteriales bacterium]